MRSVWSRERVGSVISVTPAPLRRNLERAHAIVRFQQAQDYRAMSPRFIARRTPYATPPLRTSDAPTLHEALNTTSLTKILPGDRDAVRDTLFLGAKRYSPLIAPPNRLV